MINELSIAIGEERDGTRRNCIGAVISLKVGDQLTSKGNSILTGRSNLVPEGHVLVLRGTSHRGLHEGESKRRR